MDGYGSAVVIEDDDLEQPAGTVSTDVEIAVAVVDHTDGVADGVLDVGIVDAVLASGVRDLHSGRLPCLSWWSHKSGGRSFRQRPGRGIGLRWSRSRERQSFYAWFRRIATPAESGAVLAEAVPPVQATTGRVREQVDLRAGRSKLSDPSNQAPRTASPSPRRWCSGRTAISMTW